MPFINGPIIMNNQSSGDHVITTETLYMPNFSKTGLANSNASWSTHNGLLGYMSNGHIYYSNLPYSSSYPTKKYIYCLDYNINTGEITQRNTYLGNASHGIHSAFSIICVYNGKAYINIGNVSAGFYDFATDTYTEILNESDNGYVRITSGGDSYMCFDKYWCNNNGSSNATLYDLNTLESTILTFQPIAYMLDVATNRYVWISLTGSNDKKQLQYRFADDANATDTIITSFSDNIWEYTTIDTYQSYGDSSYIGFTRWSNATHNIIRSPAYVGSNLLVMYDFYEFDSSKNDLKLREFAWPSGYFKCTNADGDIAFNTTTYNVYDTNDGHVPTLSIMSIISDEPNVWYGLLFPDMYEPADFIIKYALED